MDPIINTFKQRLKNPDEKDQVQYGLFVSLADPVAAEIAAVSDFDWLIVDTEHAPNDLRTTLVQLQATEAYDIDIVVRPQEGNRALVKRLLDIGAQTLLVPMVDTAEEAEEVVAWTRYPPNGLRGVASARAARWGQVDGYFSTADDQVCVIAQIESQEGITNLDAICAVEGVDALFVGPSDLAADMGHLGNSSHPEVQEAVLKTLRQISENGKPAGVYAATPETAERYAEAGATLVIVGVDTMVLSGAFGQLANRFKG